MGNVYVRGEPRYDLDNRWTGEYALHETPERISPTLMRLLSDYARQRLLDSGHTVPDDWAVEVEATGDRHDSALERDYCVYFSNAMGGKVGVQGILLTGLGIPHVDHGLVIE